MKTKKNKIPDLTKKETKELDWVLNDFKNNPNPKGKSLEEVKKELGLRR